MKRMTTYINTFKNNINLKLTKPAKINDLLSEVDTPCLIVNKNKLEQNLQLMKDYIDNINKNRNENNKIYFRPHAKTHKCPTLAKLQIEKYNAIGICCQKLDEVEVMIDNGIKNILMTNQCIGNNKIQRLCNLAKNDNVILSVLVDNLNNIKDLQYYANLNNIQLNILIEVNGGQNRCGINVDEINNNNNINSLNNELLIILAKEIINSNNLTFKGIHCYGGFLQHIRNANERKEKVLLNPVNKAKIAKDLLKLYNIDCEIITGAGTGSFKYEIEGNIHNELQCGSYCFMDVDYGLNEDGYDIFENALFLHTTVISKANNDTRAVIDAGLKASSLDSGPPLLINGYMNGNKNNKRNDVIYNNGGDEHGILIGDYCKSLNVGDKVRLIPGHIDPTVNMHHYLVIVDDNGNSENEPKVVDIWDISGRSPGF